MHQALSIKKIVPVIITFTSEIEASKNAEQELKNIEQIAFICYPVLFQKDIKKQKSGY